jgi:hypothetical protein
MILSSIVAGKFLVGKVTGSKVIGLSFLTSSVSDAVMGTITYHYWDGKKRKKVTVKKRHKKRRW